MPKLGLYDPNSLTAKDGVMQISFINAMDVKDVSTLPIRTLEEARRVIGYLSAQKSPNQCPLHAFGREPVRISGAYTMHHDKPGEGMIAVGGGAGGVREYTSFRLLFDIAAAGFPERGGAIITGYMEDETLVAHQMAASPYMTRPQPALATPQGDARG